MSPVFHADKVITQHISESDLCTYFVGFDLNSASGQGEYRWKPLINLLQSAITDFAFGLHADPSIRNPEVFYRLVEAAKSIYKIDSYVAVRDMYNRGEVLADDHPDKKYLSRGEFGELLLHILLRDFHGTVPLLSKIYFKDSFGATVHGFDAVHIQPTYKSLWLGESKLYSDGRKGVAALVEDIRKHIDADYLQDEFSIISKKIQHANGIPEKQTWLDLMHRHTRLADILSSVTIPMLCVYSSDNFTKHSDVTKEFMEAYENEVRDLKQYFDDKNDHPLRTNLNIILLLLPVQSKDDLVVQMHRKLETLQNLEK